MKTKVNVALIGSGFMGRTHSNGLNQVKAFFDLPVEPVKKIICDVNPEAAQKLKDRFGWEEIRQDWREVVTDPEIDVIDIATPVHTHYEIAVAAAEAGKAIICEKPLSGTLQESVQMAEAVEANGVLNVCNYNNRTLPAVGLARQLIEEGFIGEINQWRGVFMQSWLVDPLFPLTWRLRKEMAGSGALADLGSHSIDLARFLVGEIDKVCAMTHTFTKSRPVPLRDEGRNSISSGKTGEVTVDDSAWSLLQFHNSARGIMECTRMATGQLCTNQFEVYGSQGGLLFDFTRMNELCYFSLKEDRKVQGWRTINATAPVHPFMKNWWPAGHALGYEHAFTHVMALFFNAFAKDSLLDPLGDFRDAVKTQAVLEAIEESSAAEQWVTVQKDCGKDKSLSEISTQ